MTHTSLPESHVALTIVAYTDGACISNPGPGGWAVYIEYPDGRTAELSGGEEHTTNNKMELRVAIEAVRSTSDAAAVTVVTDSEYVQKGITEWIRKWKRNGWIASDGRPVKNRDLWTELDAINDPGRVTWEWRRGHAGDPGNERANELARRSAVDACSFARRQAR